MLLTAIKEYHI